MSLRSGDEIQEALRSFIGRWGNYAGTERSEAQTFLNELFAAYGADRKQVARFEDPQGSGGIVDCLYPGVAIIEMKRPGEADRLAGHRAQALDYWHHSDDPAAGLAAARFVVLCAFQRFEVWEPGRFPSAPLDSFDLAELPDRYEALYFLADEEPLFLAHRRKLTTDAATVVSRLYERRSGRASPDEISQIRYFVLQLVWCLFAESLGLLGGDPVEQIVEALIADPRRSSAAELGHLFSVLATTDQSARGGLYHGAPYVNGGLFASPARVHLDPDELALVVEAARFDWRDVDPTIFGSLMEGCLGEQRRFELGAHYTHEIDILRIVRPSIIEPWTERIAAAGTPAEMVAILDELCALQVLDPACGCGNFLYVAYREIRRLEHDAKTRVAELAASTGLPGPETLPSYAISHLHGIEVDEFTAMIARVTLWMGHKLVTDAYGAVEPVLPLVDLSGIVVGDALRVEWPAADVIIGNPPFHGSQHLRQALGDDYVEWLKRTFKCGVQDYCVYWFRRAADNLASDGRAGLVGTNSISQNKARVAGLDYVVGRGGVITAAVSTEKWPGDAKVHVSLVNWVQRPTILPEKFVLDEVRVSGISTSLRPSDDLPDPVALGGNAGFAFQGPIPVGEGFVLTAEEAHALLSDGRAPYTRVVRPYLVSEDIADDPQQHPRRWIIDFASMSLEEAERFPAALQLVRERVKPTRDKNSDRGFRELWWRFGRPRGEMRAALYGLRRYIAGTRVGKRPLFVWCENEWCPGDAVNVFGFEDDFYLGVLSSTAHTAWAWERSSTLKGDLRYTPTTAFATFPWPEPVNEDLRAVLDDTVREMVQLRSHHCAEGGFGLTRLYNSLDDGGYRDLAACHLRLDRAVTACYGWPRMVAQDRGELVARLARLNAEIVAGRPYAPFPRRAEPESATYVEQTFYDL
ncbi:MAG: DNA methyltransferase [Acidimicrobiales bacterium]